MDSGAMDGKASFRFLLAIQSDVMNPATYQRRPRGQEFKIPVAFCLYPQDRSG